MKILNSLHEEGILDVMLDKLVRKLLSLQC